MTQKFVFVGITGVGRTFLELELQKTHGFYSWPKYTDRQEQRSEEVGVSNVVFVSKEQFDEMQDDFVFTLTHLNNRSGWRRQDLVENQNKNITLSITLEAFADFMVRVPGFMPIMLHVDLENFALIEQRVKTRENYVNLTPEQQKYLDERIQERLISARYELEQFAFYQKTILKYGGKVFTIKDNNTIQNEVIPFILANREKAPKTSMLNIADRYSL